MFFYFKNKVANFFRIIGLFQPIRKIYNYTTLFNSKKVISVHHIEATFYTPTYRIREDLETLLGEREFLESFLNEIKEDDIVWDVGASYGIYSIFSAFKTIKGKVYAFEPESSTYKMLMRNVELNKLQNVVALQFALMDKTSESLLYTSRSANIGTHSMARRTDYPVSGKGKLIKTYSGDELVERNEVDFPDIIKIDVEGSEVNVLQGMAKILSSKKVRVLQIEIHPKILPLFNFDENLVLNLIESFNFCIIKNKIRGSEIELLCKKI